MAKIFGTGQKTSQDSTSRNIFDPSRLAQVDQGVSGLQGLLSSFQQNAQGLNQRALERSESLGGPQSLDRTSQGLISQELQNRNNQLQGQQNQIRQQFQGPLGHVLSQQAASRAQLANNPLSFAALQSQQGRNIQQAQAQQGLEQGGLQALGAGLSGQNTLLSQLQNIANATATKQGSIQQRQRGGGLLSGLGIG